MNTYTSNLNVNKTFKNSEVWNTYTDIAYTLLPEDFYLSEEWMLSFYPGEVEYNTVNPHCAELILEFSPVMVAGFVKNIKNYITSKNLECAVEYEVEA